MRNRPSKVSKDERLKPLKSLQHFFLTVLNNYANLYLEKWGKGYYL